MVQKNKLGSSFNNTSPNRHGGSPNKRGSPTKLSIKVKEGKAEESKGGLTTPTSITMKNSFLISNADDSFDHYYANMKKQGKNRGAGGASPAMGGHG
jgi:hypothetical protein